MKNSLLPLFYFEDKKIQNSHIYLNSLDSLFSNLNDCLSYVLDNYEYLEVEVRFEFKKYEYKVVISSPLSYRVFKKKIYKPKI